MTTLALRTSTAVLDRIRSINLSSVTLPLPNPISDAKVFTGRQRAMSEVAFLFAEIETEGGHEGLGFSYSKRAGGPAQFAHAREVAADLIGEDPSDIARLWTKLVWAGASVGRSGASTQAVAAMDIALWDLKGKRAGLPLAKPLGAHRDSVRCYNTSGGFLHESIEQVKDNATRTLEEGIGGIKIKVGLPDSAEDLRRVRAVREHPGDAVPLMVDANQQWDRPTAMRVSRRLEEFDLTWIEEPLDAYDAVGHAELARSLDTAIARGEMLTSVAEHAELIRHGAVDIIQPDAPRIGGITQFLRLATLAEQAAPGLDALGRDGRVRLLQGLADGLEARRGDIVAVADRETGLGPVRLNGELTRTCYQLRLFGEVVEEGSYLEAAIDHAGQTPMGPRPDLRRMLVPIGPVAVFGASNFPLAFSVPGGDTASALAAVGELSSLNPLIVTPSAAAERGQQVGKELVGSFTLGAGQFCTKPGLAFVPSGADGDVVLAAMAEAVRETGAQTLLNEGIAASYGRISSAMAQLPGVETVAHGEAPQGPGCAAMPLLLSTTAGEMPHEVTEECFGPLTVVARYEDEKELLTALEAMPSSLTATVLRGQGETELPLAVPQELRTRAGRLVYDAYPTGVAVSWAQHHGGPWPSPNSRHTSVGTTAIRRFLRPVTWQGAPQELLPAELTEDFSGIPRRIDGVLVLRPTVSA